MLWKNKLVLRADVLRYHQCIQFNSETLDLVGKAR